MATRKLLIIGATGKQGGSLIRALSALPSPQPFTILALTRSLTSPSAKRLAASSPHTTLIEGSSSNPSPIFATHKDIHSVFSVTLPRTKITEEDQAIPLIDASIAHNIKHFVFTSVDRGGSASDGNPTKIHHFATKNRIEQHLKSATQKSGSEMEWTILRPVAFMDNLTPDFLGKGFASMWAGLGSKPLQLVSSRDVGLFAAKAFLEPERFQGKAISVAGDELTLEQARKVFKEALGYDMPETFGFVGKGIKLAVKEMGDMFEWFRTDGCKADVEECRRLVAETQDFGKWLRESSLFEKRN